MSLPLESWFARRRTARLRAFMPYVTAGYPSFGAMPGILDMLRDAGADCLELGVPFSDPVADGVTIQASSQAALEGGATPERCLRVAERAARLGHRVVLMSYANPLLRGGLRASARRIVAAGVAGIIVPDLPLEEARGWSEAFAHAGVAQVLMAAPTTPGARLRAIDRATRGFLYYVSLTGVTGERRRLPAGLAVRLRALRR
ncbi:MAG: tryptophan synthase subunit alpha, partial [bacterium]